MGGQVHARRGSEPAPQSPRAKPKQGIPADIQMNPQGTRRALLKGGGGGGAGGTPPPQRTLSFREAFVFTWDGAQQTRLKPPVPRRPTNAILLQLYMGGGGGLGGRTGQNPLPCPISTRDSYCHP